MSLLHLLATGRSLVGMKDTHSPYRMRAENLLPKFESTKNPFAAKAEGKSESAEIPSPAKIEPVAVAKVAPMETYPLFDAELKPAVVMKEPQALRGSARVVTVTQSRLPQAQAKPGRLATNSTALEFKPETRMMEATVSSGGKVGDVAERAPSPPAPGVGLMDGSPLGLKTGNPAKNKLPAPVVAAPQAGKGAKERTPSQNNNMERGARSAECGVGKVGEGERPTSNIECPNSPAGENVRAPGVAASRAVKSKSLSGWLRKLNPFSYLPERRVARTRTAVQTELSLERVKVVRNELNDTDLEVVTMRRTEKPAATAVKPRLQAIGPAEATGFGRLTARFFGQAQAR